MNTIAALWLPILVSAVIIFFVSWVVHAVLPHHRSDHRPLPGEDAVLDAMRKAGVTPGDYLFPFAASKDFVRPEMVAKLVKGPVGFATVMRSGQWNMAPSLMQWLIYLLIICVLVAYLTGRTVAPAASYLEVFRVSGTAAFLAFSGSHATSSIWYKRSWRTTTNFILDGLVYALLVGGVFGWLWP